jgi:hypothetical protein
MFWITWTWLLYFLHDPHMVCTSVNIFTATWLKGIYALQTR